MKSNQYFVSMVKETNGKRRRRREKKISLREVAFGIECQSQRQPNALSVVMCAMNDDCKITIDKAKMLKPMPRK